MRAAFSFHTLGEHLYLNQSAVVLFFPETSSKTLREVKYTEVIESLCTCVYRLPYVAECEKAIMMSNLTARHTAHSPTTHLNSHDPTHMCPNIQPVAQGHFIGCMTFFENACGTNQMSIAFSLLRQPRVSF